MRQLTPEEKEIVDRRRRRFEAFLEERMPALTDFMQRLELPYPALVLVEADQYVAPLDRWLEGQVIESEDETWIVTRLGYFVGEYLVQRLGGHWFLNDIADTRYFARYVVGRFTRVSNLNAMVDPFEVAFACVAEPVGRSLQRLLTSIEIEVRQS